MKKGLKIAGYGLLGMFTILYAGFLFVLPNVININDYKTDVVNLVKDTTNLNLDFQNAKITTTPLLGIGVKADDISVKFDDNSDLFTADNIKTRISIPSLFLMTVKVSCFEANNPKINLEIQKNNKLKLIKFIEDKINAGKEQKLVAPIDENEVKKFKFNPAWIRIKVPNAKLNNYSVLVNDLGTGHYLNLKGEKLEAGYFNKKSAKLKTYAELFSDNDKNITANIDIDTFLPKFGTKLDKEDDPAERVDISIVNPVKMYRNYNLKANVDSKLKVRNFNGNIYSFGHFNIDNITLKVMNLQLPESYVHIDTFANKINTNTKLYPMENEFLEIVGNVTNSKNPNCDLNIKTSTIKFNNMVILAKAFLDSLQIKNELYKIQAQGTLDANCHIKTNFKKLISNGSIVIKNGGLNVSNFGKIFSDGNININLDDNVLDIRNSSILIDKSPLYIDGKINEKSVANIVVKADKIPLPSLFRALAPENLKKQFNLKNGDVSLNLEINGQLKEALANLNLKVNNLNVSNKNLGINNNQLTAEFVADKKNLTGNITNDKFAIYLPKTNSKISIPKMEIQIADKNITLNENSILLNNKSSIKYSGNIEDYTTLKAINLNADGSINTTDLMNLIGKELSSFFNYKGNIPVKMTFDGSKKKQTLFAQALCDKENFFTPINFKNINNEKTSLQSVVDFKENRIKIKKTGLFKRIIEVDEKGNEIVKLDEVVGVDGTIEKNRINLIKITMPQPLIGTIYAFPNSKFSLKGKGFVFGETKAPRFRGDYELSNLSIPELMTSLKEAKVDLASHNANFSVKDLILNGSDIQAEGKISLRPSKDLNISNLTIKSKDLNVDKTLKVVEKATSYLPKATPAKSQKQNTQTNIPVVIQNGNIDFNRISVGNINIKNTIAKLQLANNILNVNNMRTNIFNGSANGNIAVDLAKLIVNVNVKGNRIDVEKALLDAANMKHMLSGRANFDTKISLQGTTLEEQMKSLKGDVNFTVKDGQFGPFSKLENLILAENIRESQLFQNAIGGIINGLTTIDTSHFDELVGTLNFENGICNIKPITSSGNILSIYIDGNFDLLKNTADMKVRARMASLVSNLLGPISAINPTNLIGNAANMNIVTAKAFSLFCVLVPESEMDMIPKFSNKYVDNSATKFQIIVKGDVAKPLKLVKSFKWLSTEKEYQAATDFVNSIPEPVEGSEATTIEEIIQESEAEKRTLKYKVKNMFKNEASEVKTEIPQEKDVVEPVLEVEPALENNSSEEVVEENIQ